MPKKFTRLYTLREGEALSDPVLAGLREQSKLFAGGEVEVSLSRPKRKDKQNRLLWWMYKIIRRHLIDAGLPAPPDWQIHEYVKTTILGTEPFEVAGVELHKPRSSTGLDTTEFSDLIESVKQAEWVLALCIDWEREAWEAGQKMPPPPPVKPETAGIGGVELPALADFAGAELHDEPLTMDQISSLF